MVSMADLKVVDVRVEEIDNTTWANVEYNGNRYILTATNVTDDVMDRMAQEDPMLAMMFLFGLPRFDCAVFRGDENWTIVGECNDECAKGVCTKRIAQAKPLEPTIEISYNLLLDYLNS
jgi:hypothetical protein